MPKTILKLHENGDFETVGVQLTQDGNAYSFTENAITVPKIIKYPPVGYQNYFIEKTSTSGYIAHHAKEGVVPGQHEPATTEGERVSDLIDVNGWNKATVRIHFYNFGSAFPLWASIQLFDNAKNYLGYHFRDYLTNTDEGYYLFESKFNVDVGFIAVSSNYYDYVDSTVKISVEKGDTSNAKHYLAFEDMPEWVVDTGNPISIFPQGIVIKGNLI